MLLAHALSVAALAGEPLPAVHLSWRGEEGLLRVHPPQGEHIAGDAPFDLSLSVDDRVLVVQGMGVDLRPGVRVGEVRGLSVSGMVSVSLCEDGGVRCRVSEVSVVGAASERRRGQVALGVTPYEPPERRDVGDDREERRFPRGVDARSALDAGVARATARGVPLVLSFGAVWCPPCQRLDHEVFLATPQPAVLGGIERAWIDVDDPSSWALKDRYEVGGYPTQVAIAPEDGEVLGRLEGYPGRDAVIAWIDTLLSEGLAPDRTDPGPVEAGRRAWRAVQEGRRADAAALMDVARRAPDEVPYRLARFHLDPTLEDARWLSERAPREAMSWVPALRGRLRDDPQARRVAQEAIHRALGSAEGAAAADLLSEAAQLTEDPLTRRLTFASAARLVESTLTGDPVRDRGRLAWLAWLEEQAGHTASALGRLEAARNALPDEPTFHLASARLMLRLGLTAEAIPVAESALETSWGDNRLQAAKVLAEAWLAVGRPGQAREVARAVLDALPAPDPALDVRTHRMRAELRELVE